MALEVSTIEQTEAELEARIAETLHSAFPWLPADSLQHQLKFTFKFGHKVVDIDGAKVSAAQARADILIRHNETPLAVLELKRAGLPLSKEDQDQGLSYARMIHPRPPLVVVTNGTDFIFLESHTGNEWEPETRSEAELLTLIQNAGKLAAGDMKRAIDTLMGPGSNVWMSALRAATEATLDDLTGDWNDFEKPFVEGFLIPRRATAALTASVVAGHKVTIVEGAPLMGKSSVVREFALRQSKSDEMAVLFVDADSHGGGLIAAIAAILADVIGWQITPDDTRLWLARMSKQEGPALVLAIDGVGATRNELKEDIKQLADRPYGNRLQMVLSMDDTVSPLLTKSENGRRATSIGRQAKTVPVEALDLAEHKLAVRELAAHRIRFTMGAQASVEFRVPWMIRALAAEIVDSPEYADETLEAKVPPVLGTLMLLKARVRFADDIREMYRLLAGAVLKDVKDKDRTKRPLTTLQAMNAFVIRRKTLTASVSRGDLRALSTRGYAKSSINAEEESVVIARLPELLASELAKLLADGIATRDSNAQKAAKWLVRICSRIPMGDVIGAQAIFDYAEIKGGIPLNFVRELLLVPPRVEKLRPGQKLAMSMPDGNRVNLTILENGKVVLQGQGLHEVLDADEFSESDMYADMDSWMILAHLAAHPSIVQDPEGNQKARADPMLLTEVGTAPMALRRHSDGEGLNSIPMHHIPEHGAIVCHEAGIVEPITWSIALLLSRDGPVAEEWLDEAIERNSLPLLARLDIALRETVRHAPDATAEWASRMLNDKVRPRVLATPLGH